MKNLIILTTLCALLVSCSKNSEDNLQLQSKKLSTSFPQKWQLIKMTGSMANSVTTGTNMAWQEQYTFNSDGTFIKQRTQNNASTEGSGTFKVVTLSGEEYIEMTYATDSDIIASCTSQEKTEYLFVVSATELKGTWDPCDGPGLFYQKMD